MVRGGILSSYCLNLYRMCCLIVAVYIMSKLISYVLSDCGCVYNV